MRDLKILGLQPNLVWEDPQANRDNFEKIINENFDAHDLIIIPETFTTGFPVNPQKFAEEIDGPSLAWMQKTASEYKTTLTGSFLLSTPTGFSNSLFWVSPDKSFRRYDKRHVFSMGGEHKSITAGKQQLTVELNGWKIRPMICYDLRFPVWSKNKFLNGQFEYDMAIYVANWPAVRSYPWRQLLIARAIENMACVVGINRVGTDGPGNNYSGNSMFVDAKGSILKEGANGEETALSHSFSSEKLISFRKKFNVGFDWDKFEIG
jgi:predicted amidohydrolase